MGRTGPVSVSDVVATARPFFMFQGGIAREAMDLYCSTIPNSAVVRVEEYAEGESGPPGTIKVAVFTLCGREFMCSDSPIEHGFSFTPSSSTFVEFDSLDQLERAFATLSEGGEVLIAREEGAFDTVSLARDYSVGVNVTLPPRGITYFVVKRTAGLTLRSD